MTISASRRGRRADQAEPDWRAASRSGNQYPAQNPRDSQPQNAAYSGFTRQSYSQQPYSPPHQEPAPPALPQQGRAYDAPQGYYQDPAPQVPQQSYYQDPAPRLDPQRGYVDPASPYAPAPSPYDSGSQQTPYGAGAYGAAGGELFGRDQSMPQSFDQNPYGAGTGYRAEAYEPAQPYPALAQPPYAPRAPQESSAPQYYLPEEQPQRSAPPLAAQPPLDRGYQQQQALYSPASYDQPLVPHESYQRGNPDPHFPGDVLPFDDEMRTGRPPMAGHSDDFDEEFPDEDFDHEDYGVPQKHGRKKLFAALLLSAAAVVVGGTYGYKAYFGGKGGGVPPLIKAEMNPSKEVPANPGGKQFPHGEKSIYERLTPDGRTQVASAATAAMPAFTTSATANTGGGSSLEDRIDEALKRAQNTGDTPSGGPVRSGSEQPTVVRSESYGPDGRRLELAACHHAEHCQCGQRQPALSLRQWRRSRTGASGRHSLHAGTCRRFGPAAIRDPDGNSTCLQGSNPDRSPYTSSCTSRAIGCGGGAGSAWQFLCVLEIRSGRKGHPEGFARAFREV